MKTFNLIRVITVFLLILIPLIYLYNFFNELELKHNAVSSELIKEQILSEMNRFQEDLKPEKHIETAFKDLEKSFGFPDLENSQYKYVISKENKPDYIDKNFIKYAKTFLKDKYGFEPFVFVSAGADFTNIDFSYKDFIIKNEKDKNKFIYSCLGNILYYYLNENDYNLINKLRATLPEFNEVLVKEFNNIIEFNKGYNEYNEPGQYFADKFVVEIFKNISIFYRELGRPSSCYTFFTNKFGLQKVYQYYNLFIINKDKFYNFLGSYYVLIKSSDILINKILYVACNRPNLSISNIKRNISNKVVSVPSWDETETYIKYYSPFPFYFYNFVQEHDSINKESSEIYLNYIQNHSLELYIDKSNKKNIYSEYKKYLIISIIILSLLLFFIIINTFFNIIKTNISLSFKVKMIVLIAVAIPMVGLFIIFNLTLKNEEKIYITNIENKINERIHLFEKLKDDILNNFTFDLLEHKKIFADSYFLYNSDNIFNILSGKRNKYLSYNKAINLINSFYKHNKSLPYNLIVNAKLLDKNGKNIEFSNYNHYGKTLKFMDYMNLFRIMNDMNFLDLNTRENKENQKQNIICSTYMGSLFESHNTQNVLAKESFLIPPEGSFSKLKEKISYQLLAPNQNPNSPQALLHSLFDIRSIISYRETKELIDNYNNLLSQEIGRVQIKYAFFDRNTTNYKEKIPQPKSYPFRQLQIDAVELAIQKENSGSDISLSDNYYYLKVWRYYSDTPIIIVSAAIIPKTNINFITGKIFALLLTIYSILAVVLLSDFFSGELLEPIKSLSKFVKEISYGNINVKINIETGDELQELGNSFNKMSVGLCEREKLKRFVSDKLFSSLKNSNENRITKAKVTILSSDIRSFTTISERNKPEEVVSLLNEYFTLMEKSIVKYGGSIEKIVGDAISAAFYEETDSNHALNACKAALEMRNNLKLFNQQREQKGLFTIENGVGLATGDVMIGFAGKKARRREFLIMGSIIKEAEMLESMTKKAVSSKVFIDKQTFESVKDKISLCSEVNNCEIFYRELSL